MTLRTLPFLAVVGLAAPAAAQPARMVTNAPQPMRSTAARRAELICAPLSVPDAPAQGLHVTGSIIPGRLMFGPGDAMFLSGGTGQGLKAGQQFFVRRVVNDKFSPGMTDKIHPYSIHTAGWVEIVTANENVAVAEVRQACDGILIGDFLEPFADPVVPEPAAVQGEPDYSHPARIVLADERQQTAAPGMLMLIDRGSDEGVRAGQAVTIYRETLSGAGPVYRVGLGEILNVRPLTSLIRINSSRDAVYVGDLVAVHRMP